jgi:outer membrane protein assembly factor BamB
MEYVISMYLARLARLVLGLSLLARAIQAEDWPHWRGPDGNGISQEKAWTTAWPQEGPALLWRANVSTGFSAVAVARGRLFTLGNSNTTEKVFCLDAGTGREIWHHAYACPLDPEYHEGGPGATPTVDGDRIYTLGKRGHLFCLEAATGRILWQKHLTNDLGTTKPRWGFACSPLIEGDLLILNAGAAGAALDKLTGKPVWTSGTNAPGYATAVPFTAGAERCTALFAAKTLVGVRVIDGRERWRVPWVTKWDVNAADPILVGDRIFISSFDRGAALWDVSGAAPRAVWENREMANQFNSCVLVGGFLYGIHGNSDQAYRDLRCLEAANGEVKWKQEGLGLGSLMAADGRLVILSDKGELVIAEATPIAFRPLARAQVLGGKCWTVPVLANGRIYCRNAAGTLVCLDVREAKSR